VAKALSIIRKHACQFAVRSGGHAPFAGASVPPDGVAIDLGGMRNLLLSADGTHVQVGPGNRWSDVYRYLEEFGMSASGSRNGDVGVGGSILGGIVFHQRV
jgi:FAD/FMN-containing dehydrogenase